MIDSILIGPIVGAIGGVASQWFALKSKAIDLEDRKSQRDHDRQMSSLQHQQALEMTRVEAAAAERKVLLEGEIKTTTADLANLNTAMQSMPTWSGIQQDDSPTMRWFKTTIEAAATMVRIVVTLYLAIKIAWMVDAVFNRLPETIYLPADLMGEVAGLAVRGFIEAALTAVSFWFGARSTVLKQQPSRGRSIEA